MPEPNTTIHAKWETNMYTVVFETRGGTPLETEVLPYGASLDSHTTTKDGDLFFGWSVNDALTECLLTVPVNDDDTATMDVFGGYAINRYELIYEAWYFVRTWAESNGYTFINLVKEGTYGDTGGTPTQARKHHPVLAINWWDAIVWTNALSEMIGLTPFYRDADGSILRTAKATRYFFGEVIFVNEGGYRLPFFGEWQIAARWMETKVNHSVSVGGRFWTPGVNASGSPFSASMIDQTDAFSWMNANTSSAQAVGQKIPNQLGIHDMSGNIKEWCKDGVTIQNNDVHPYALGGDYQANPPYVRVGYEYSTYADHYSAMFGLRLARSI
jgi:hypothetical protein